MTAETIGRKIRLHNALQWALGLGLIPVTLFLWWVSWWFFRLAFFTPAGYLLENAWQWSFYVAWLCMIPLAVEGLRDSRPLWDFSEYVRSEFHNNFITQNQTSLAGWYYTWGTMEIAYLAAQLVYSAPRTTVHSFRALRSFLPCNQSIVERADEILTRLRSDRKWIPATEFPDSGAALIVLDELDLIWSDLREGTMMVRIPPSEK